MRFRGCLPVSLPLAAPKTGGGNGAPALFHSHSNGGIRLPVQIRALADGGGSLAGAARPSWSRLLWSLAAEVRHG